MVNQEKQYKLGFALSGGGARGFAHLGVLQALMEEGIEPDIYSGVSAGALVGVYLADGKSPRKILRLLENKGIFNYSNLHLPYDGLLTLKGLAEELNQNFGGRDISDLEKPLIISVANLNSGKVENKKKGSIVDWVSASCSIPVLFAPIKINGHSYADGGIFDNLAIKPLIGRCDSLVAVNVSPIEETESIGNVLKVASRVFYLRTNFTSSYLRRNCSLLIEPKGVGKYDILDTKHARKIFDLGYNYVKEYKLHEEIRTFECMR